MASDRIALRVLTESGTALDDEAVSIRAPGALGSFGILRSHAPLISTLVPGPLTWRRPDGVTKTVRIEGGLLEIVRNRCTVLTPKMGQPAAAPAGRIPAAPAPAASTAASH
jgi:F-type H+-transporting ATPase subunit epsilon